MKVDKGIRILNFMIDLLIITLITIIIDLIFSVDQSFRTEFYLIYFFYYLIFESISGQTVGKLITKTKVIKRNNKKASFLNIFYRSILRLIPIDSFSYIFGTEQGFHDVLSGTKLIIQNKEAIDRSPIKTIRF